MLTVFSVLLNESILLPSWLDHHRRLFDHGVLIDWGSTDESREIIRRICPTWEIVSPKSKRCDYFDVIEQEHRFKGWKVAMNTSEFLCVADLRSICAEEEMLHPELEGFRTEGCWISPADPTTKSFARCPLVDHHLGFAEEDAVPGRWGRQRVIHRAADGGYEEGHGYHISNRNVRFRQDVHLAWFGRLWPELWHARTRAQQGIDSVAGERCWSDAAQRSWPLEEGYQYRQDHLQYCRDLSKDKFYGPRLAEVRRMHGVNP